MDNYDFLVREYEKLEKAYRSVCGGDEEKLRAFRTHIGIHVMRVWSAELTYDPDYGKALSVIYEGEIMPEETIRDFMRQAKEKAYITVSEAFVLMVAQEARTGAPDCKAFVDDLVTFLTDMAFVNGDCTAQEANEIEQTRWIYMDFYEEFMENVRGVKEGRLPEGQFVYNRYGANITYGCVKEAGREDFAKKDTEKEKAEESKKESEAAPEKTLEELLAELDGLVGLDAVKKDIHTLMNFIKVCELRKARGLKAAEVSYHLVFSGNPGTGKTTVARLLAKLYKQIGILKTGQLVEVDRSGLVAGYVGQTAIKTAKVIEEAIGGVLFIDEAYALAESDEDSYGKECIATILKAMEDHRDELVVIVAGYDELMHKFIEANPGLRSRFNKYLQFPDYNGEEMEKIFLRQCESNGYRLEPAAQALAREAFDRMYETRDENFGNGRTVRNVFEKVINCQANRLAEDPDITDEELMGLTEADVKEGLGLLV